MAARSAAHRACVVCHDATAAEHFCTFGNLAYVRCRGCALVYVDRMASDAEMRSAYTGRWVRKLRRRLTARFRKLHNHRHYQESIERARKIFDFAMSHVTGDRTAIRFLDIGCNKGFLLSAGIARGADVHGIELVPEIMIPFGNTYPQLRAHVYSEKLSQVAPRLGADCFDLITAIDVVEHFEDPIADMAHIHRMLRAGGVAIIQTPDASCAQAQQERCAWGALKPLEHLHLFSRENFVTFAKARGFQVVEIGEPFEHADGNFVAVLRK